METAPQPVGDAQSHLYHTLEDYDWDNDVEFQGGLRAILNTAAPDQTPRLIARAKCYYFARKNGIPVDFEGYLGWTKTRNDQPNVARGSVALSEQSNVPDDLAQEPLPSPMGKAPPPASFADICELIAEGKPIPGIKDIPDTVLADQATQSHAVRRKKPWEKDAAPAPTPAWARPN